MQEQRSFYRAVITDANRHGGLLGHPIVPVFYGIDVTGDQAAEYQSACADFTQDQHVFAAIGLGSDAYYSCLERAGVLEITPNSAEDGQAQQQWHLQFAPGGMILDRVARTLVDASEAKAFFSGWSSATGTAANGGRASVGVLTYDAGPAARVASQILVPELKRQAGSVVVQSVQQVQQASDVGTMSSQVASAVLHFRSAGVDHVVFFVDGGLPEAFFMNDAESQGYHPRYAFTSNDDLEADLASGLIQNPSGQLAGSLGVGWQPIADEQYPSPFLRTPAMRHCLAVAKAGGVTVSSSTPAGQLAQACDGVWFLQRAAQGLTAVTSAGLASQALHLGTDFGSPETQATRFAGNTDGAAAYQILGYLASCSCIEATTGTARAAT